MNSTERRAVISLAGIFALRMLGLFSILPVFALYAVDLDGATPFLIGLALGAYGLTQAIFQIPFGIWSDRYGRKPVIAIGLIIFALGSLVAAVSDSITGIIFGRALQGSGAIAAAILALTADLTRADQRTKAMAVIGISIGAMFILAVIFAPVVEGWVGVPGLFWLTFILTIPALAVLWWLVPAEPRVERKPETMQFAGVLKNAALLKLDTGIFVLHLVMTALFVVTPGVIAQVTGWQTADHWKIYVPVLILSVIGMLPLVKRHSGVASPQRAFLIAIAILGVSQAVLVFTQHSLPLLIVALWLFFVGFNALEAMLPSQVSRLAPTQHRGAALGVYSTTEYLGVFVGGALGGWLHGQYGVNAVYLFSLVMVLLWLFVAAGLPGKSAVKSGNAVGTGK